MYKVCMRKPQSSKERNQRTMWKGYILYNSNCITLWKRLNCEHSKQLVVTRSWRVKGGMNGQNMKFLGQWKYFIWYHNERYMPLYICINTYNVPTPRVNYNVNCGLGNYDVSKCIICNKYTTLVGDVQTVGGYACVEAGVDGKSLYLPINFVVNIKNCSKQSL